MNKSSIKTVFSVVAFSLGCSSVSAHAIPIAYFNAGNTTYLNSINNNSDDKPTLWKNYTEPKAKNVTLESLSNTLKNKSLKKDDVIAALGLVTNYLYNSINTSSETTQEKAVNTPVKTSHVPEPTSLLLLGLGVLGIAGLRSRKV